MAYFEKEDILHLMVALGPEAQSVELSPDVTVEMDAQGQILGIEILNASRFISDLVVELHPRSSAASLGDAASLKSNGPYSWC